MFWNKYPYTNFHELNLDWIIQRVKALNEEWDEFKVKNSITFSGSWNITNQYPAWCIVTKNGGKEWYISIKPVPEGVQITNTDYWELLMSNLLESTRRFLFVSDSYGASIVPQIVSMMGLDNEDYTSIQQGGSGFGATYGTPLNWQTMIENTVTVDDYAYTDVVYIGGANEAAITPSQVTANAAACYDYVANRFENSKQWYMFAAYAGGINGDTYDIGQRVRVLRRIPGCINDSGKNFIYCECWYPLADTDNMGADLLHPNNTGAKYIAQEIASYLNGGNASYVTDCQNPFELDVTDTGHTVNWFQLDMYRMNDTVKGTIRAANINLASAFSITSGTSTLNLGKISSRLIRGGNLTSNGANDLMLGSTIATFRDANSALVSLPVKIMLGIDNVLKVTVTPAWNYAPPVVADKIEISNFNFEITGYLN